MEMNVVFLNQKLQRLYLQIGVECGAGIQGNVDYSQLQQPTSTANKSE